MKRGGRQAFTMIEVSLALAVIGTCMTALMGLMALSINTARDASDDNKAAVLAQAILADRLATSFTSSTPYSSTALSVSSGLGLSALNTTNVNYLFAKKDGTFYAPNGTPGAAYSSTSSITFAQLQQAYYLCTVVITHPAGSPTNSAQYDISITWPSAAPARLQTSQYFSTFISK